MSNFEFGSEKRLSRLTLARAEKLNALFAEIAAMSETKISFTINGDIDADGGKIINAANGTDPQDLVTKAQLDATAFAPALPGQTGNAGRFITTDGTNASWTDGPVRFDVVQVINDPQKAQARSNINAADATATANALAAKADASAMTAALALKADSSAVTSALATKASLTGAETLTNKTLTSPVLNDPQGAFVRGFYSGLAISNNALTPNDDVDVMAGFAASDGATPVIMILASAITKRLNLAWQVGNNQGGLDTGTKQPNTWYFPYLIQRSDTGVVDVCLSASATSPTTGGNIPAAYDRKRRLSGAIRTDGSGNIRAFKQRGRRRFEFAARIDDISVGSQVTTPILRTITVPPNMIGILQVQFAGAEYLEISNPDQPAINESATAGTTFVTSGRAGIRLEQSVDGASQIRTKVNVGSVPMYISTLGFEDGEF
jgi:hypothetical protein